MHMLTCLLRSRYFGRHATFLIALRDYVVSFPRAQGTRESLERIFSPVSPRDVSLAPRSFISVVVNEGKALNILVHVLTSVFPAQSLELELIAVYIFAFHRFRVSQIF